MIPPSAPPPLGDFEVGNVYVFNPPILTRCIHVCEPREWQQQIFSQGVCVGFSLGYYIFRGFSLNDGLGRDFLIRCGNGGSSARVVGKPKLYIVR